MSGPKKAKLMSRKKHGPMVKHGGGPFLLWGCFAFAVSGNLDCMKNIMDSLKYQAILAKIVKPSVQRLKLDDQWTFQQDNHPKVYIQIS